MKYSHTNSAIQKIVKKIVEQIFKRFSLLDFWYPKITGFNFWNSGKKWEKKTQNLQRSEVRFLLGPYGPRHSFTSFFDLVCFLTKNSLYLQMTSWFKQNKKIRKHVYRKFEPSYPRMNEKIFSKATKAYFVKTKTCRNPG